MSPEFLNHTKTRIPQKYVIEFLVHCLDQLKKKKAWPRKHSGKSLQLVFLPKNEAKQLNKQFRGKDYATDVLSFDSMDPDSLGELIFCPEVLIKQAAEHGLSFRDELCYMTLHGLLHLLGYDHETNEADAKKMFRLQDSIFDSK